MSEIFWANTIAKRLNEEVTIFKSFQARSNGCIVVQTDFVEIYLVAESDKDFGIVLMGPRRGKDSLRNEDFWIYCDSFTGMLFELVRMEANEQILAEAIKHPEWDFETG